MAIRLMCDVCNKELQRNAAADRIKRRSGNVSVEVLVSYKGTWNSGEVCEACVLKIVNQGNIEQETQT
jgi:hypothetical protein